jgi:hypothetical protein
LRRGSVRLCRAVTRVRSTKPALTSAEIDVRSAAAAGTKDAQMSSELKAQALAAPAGNPGSSWLTLFTSAPAPSGGSPASPVSTAKPLTGRSFTTKLVYSPSTATGATISRKVGAVSTAPTAPAREKQGADTAVTAILAAAIGGGW